MSQVQSPSQVRPGIIALVLSLGFLCAAHAALRNGTESAFWQKLQAGETPSVVIVGHSTSQAWPSPFCSSSKSFVPWPKQLKAELESSGAVDVLSCTCAGNPSTAFAGDNDSYGRDGIEWLTSQQADAVIMEFAIGADCVGRFDITVAESKATHNQIIDEILAARSDTEIFLWTGARSYGSKWEDRSSRSSSDEAQPEYAQMYVELAAERNLYVVDTYTELLRIHDQEGFDTYRTYMLDENHTNDKAGEELIVPAIIATMKGEILPWDLPLRLLTPQPNDRAAVGEVMNITWDYNASVVTEGIEVSFSPDGGASWVALNMSPIAAANKSYEWTVPEAVGGTSMLTTQGVIKINEYNTDNEAMAGGITIIPAGVEPIIIDNGEASVEVIGDWTTSTSTTGYYGLNYFWDGGDPKTGKKVIYKASLPSTGRYEIAAMWTAHENRSSAAPYEIHTTGGVQTVTANQEENGGQWNVLGEFNLARGTQQPVVTINAEGSPGDQELVVADAIRITYLGGSAALLRTATAGAAPLGTARVRMAAGIEGGYRVVAPRGAVRMAVYDMAGRLVATRHLGAALSTRRMVRLPAHLSNRGVLCVRFTGETAR